MDQKTCSFAVGRIGNQGLFAWTPLRSSKVETDRLSQTIYNDLGQADRRKRLSGLSINMGGATSIGIKQRGVDKAYGLAAIVACLS
ncbi:hypothetical protein ACRE_047370 [Hapsidospora chrysogenum ATCC 11550]|uniref:Uncharacterized protein n=1 Tax=Hapsidospora chrysogenum (strain ATCC 11550 / CBS 779.69 / DSM 880 / IAM 14645 / JCM 23072 / IMI 49137) TaxID=857340 RepID=A0A086T528_HAPC1|nr:hypothetical protein ACRE_047370 [Hapsidospora chrysogenum ATCC 11550]